MTPNLEQIPNILSQFMYVTGITIYTPKLLKSIELLKLDLRRDKGALNLCEPCWYLFTVGLIFKMTRFSSSYEAYAIQLCVQIELFDEFPTQLLRTCHVDFVACVLLSYCRKQIEERSLSKQVEQDEVKFDNERVTAQQHEREQRLSAIRRLDAERQKLFGASTKAVIEQQHALYAYPRKKLIT